MGDKAPVEEVLEEEEVEAAIIIVLLTQMSHRYPCSTQAMTQLTVEVCQIAVTTPKGVVKENYHRFHQEVLRFTVALYEDAALAEHTNRK